MIYLRATIRALESQIEDLKARLDKAESERTALLDRLLEKRNIEPITTQPEKPKSQQSIQVIAPYGVPQDAQDAIRESWLAEETAYLKMMHGYDDDRARVVAEQNYLKNHRTFN